MFQHVRGSTSTFSPGPQGHGGYCHHQYVRRPLDPHSLGIRASRSGQPSPALLEPTRSHHHQGCCRFSRRRLRSPRTPDNPRSAVWNRLYNCYLTGRMGICSRRRYTWLEILEDGQLQARSGAFQRHDVEYGCTAPSGTDLFRLIGSIQRLHEIIDFASFWRRLALASLYVGIAVRRCGFKMSEQYRK